MTNYLTNYERSQSHSRWWNVKWYYKYIVGIFLFLLLGLNSFTFAQSGRDMWRDSVNANDWCRDAQVKLNTDVPFVGKCIPKWDSTSTFVLLMWGLSKLLMTIILIAWFFMIVLGWVFITMWWASQKMSSQWKALIMKVVIWIILIWASGIILNIVNPNFFK